MAVLSPAEQWSGAQPACITLGNFDGVHLGHQALFKKTAEIAASENLTVLPVTFWPHPRSIISRHADNRLLTTRQEKNELISALGIAHILEIPFTAALAQLKAEEFVKRFLLPLKPRHIVIGHDFHFGHEREGSLTLLNQLGKRFNFQVSQVEASTMDGAPISSSRIRSAILTGDMEKAAKLLGRPYSLSGKVVHGFGRGAGLGFPTANMELPDKLLPPHGVYAAHASIAGMKEKSACFALTNIGDNPTFNGVQTTIETFLPDERIDLYGRELKVDFLMKIRDEKKFASITELKEQIAADIKNARTIFSDKHL